MCTLSTVKCKSSIFEVGGTISRRLFYPSALKIHISNDLFANPTVKLNRSRKNGEYTKLHSIWYYIRCNFNSHMNIKSEPLNYYFEIYTIYNVKLLYS